ncbi:MULTISPECIES: CoA transferase [Pseudomonas aeruginosa group]|uniref:CoA transferase n=1 Tax=Pseudomonas aeruginosa group TaxID=136841 RepID=UPI001F41B75B|nr:MULTISPECIES: CoA transferase [Pseudomonas aeruginosa group]MDV7986644.1 CoA transferase [Pseudomonas paraeruginosa]MDY1589734.1 CoA transferase [Pseudomonas paraeruginosa]
MTALNGLRVIEIGTLIAAPFAARLMGEFGAEIIKIESIGTGDPLRNGERCTKTRLRGGISTPQQEISGSQSQVD